MDYLVAQSLSGVAMGSVYACLGLAFVLIYQSTHHINFAQGEMATFCTYIALCLIQAGAGYWLAFFGACVFAFGFGLLIQYVVLKPVKAGSPLSSVIVFIALLVIINSLSGLFFGHGNQQFPSPFSGERAFAAVPLSFHELGIIAIALIMMLLIYLFLEKTSLGLALKAVSRNPVSSRLSGIRVERMYAIGWGLSSVVGTVAGMLVAPLVFLDPNMMLGLLLYGVAAAFLGGIESPCGAIVGGLLIGIIENLVGAYLGSEFKLAVALIVILLVLLVRPAGLFGRLSAARV